MTQYSWFVRMLCTVVFILKLDTCFRHYREATLRAIKNSEPVKLAEKLANFNRTETLLVLVAFSGP